MSNTQKIKQAATHKPFDFNSEKHQQFIKNQLTIIQEMTTQFPHLNFEEVKELLVEAK